MDVLEDLLLKSIESQKRFAEYIYRLFDYDYEKAFTEYANSIGKSGYSELTEEEKKQAILDAVIKDCDALTEEDKQRAVMDAVIRENSGDHDKPLTKEDLLSYMEKLEQDNNHDR